MSSPRSWYSMIVFSSAKDISTRGWMPMRRAVLICRRAEGERRAGGWAAMARTSNSERAVSVRALRRTKHSSRLCKRGVAVGDAHRLELALFDLRVVGTLAGNAHRHGVVARSELYHVHARDGEQRLEVLDRLFLLDHDGADAVVATLQGGEACALEDEADVAAHADAVKAGVLGLWALVAHGVDALLDVLHGARVRPEDVLDAGARDARAPVEAAGLVHLGHARHVREHMDGAPDVVQGVQVVRSVLWQKGRQVSGGRRPIRAHKAEGARARTSARNSG
eukprot:COSAG06_NODE_1821_length_8290_cov_33.022586_4_plen_280_part_00